MVNNNTYGIGAYFSKLCLLLFLLFGPFAVSATNCNKIEKDIKQRYENLISLIAQENVSKAYALSDSLLNILKSQNAESCPIGLWIKFYKGEALGLKLDFEKALQLFYQIIREAESSQDWQIVAQSHISIASCYEWIRRPKDCLRHLQMAKNLIQKHQLENVASRFAVRYASYHRIYDNKDTARVYAKKAVDLGKKTGVLRSQYDGYLLLGSLTNDLAESLQYLRLSAALFLEQKNYLGAGLMYCNIARKYIKNRQSKIAIKTVDTAQVYASMMPEKDKNYYVLTYNILNLKREYFSENKMMDSAYYYLLQSNEHKKKSEWLVDQEKIEFNAIEFAVEKEKEKAINLLKITRFYKWGTIILAIFLAILTWAFYTIYTKKQQISNQNQQINQNNENLNALIQKQSLLLSEIHHRVKNNLQLVISLLTLRGHTAKSKSVKSYLEDLSKKVFSISLIHEQLYKKGDFEKIDIKDYIEELISHFSILQDTTKNINFESDIDPVMLNLETVLPLGIICSELISNSMKYAQTDSNNVIITISIKIIASKYLMTYQDNGPGFSGDLAYELKPGMGLMIIENMVRQLQGESSRYNDAGAIFTLLFEEKIVSAL